MSQALESKPASVGVAPFSCRVFIDPCRVSIALATSASLSEVLPAVRNTFDCSQCDAAQFRHRIEIFRRLGAPK